ncbi:MAG: NYN domain-containing protein [Rhodopila sp.]|nr:NYN domain-containing protein [Rhodopila sp.]
MANEARATRLAVLIDADNAPPQIATGLFEEIAKLGEASVRRIYGDFSGTKLKSWAEHLSQHAIIPHQNFANTPGKNASDIALVIDAMDLLHSGRFDGFCLVSSDSDFTRLAARIREQGLDVYGFGEQKTPSAFRQACKRFFYTENLLPPPPKPPEPPRPAKTEKPDAKPEAKPARVIEPVSAALELLRKAVAQLADEDGWARLGAVGAYVLTLAPDFDTRSYGYSKLSSLVTKSGQFEVRRDPAKFIFIRSLPVAENPPEDAEIPF